MTLSPLITELLRWDVNDQNLGRGSRLLNLGSNKGVFLVPDEANEVDIGLPSYEQRTGSAAATGVGDYQFLLVKQRLITATATQGDYILSAAFSVQAPIGATAFTNHSYVMTPALMGGKGFGHFDLQASTAVAIPASQRSTSGFSWISNIAAQYRVMKIFWPELEMNWTHWIGGTQRAGLDQLMGTVGILAGALPISRHLKLTLGAGFQFALAPAQRYRPVATPLYRNNVIFSGRLSF
jgi:hypothetical protein